MEPERENRSSTLTDEYRWLGAAMVDEIMGEPALSGSKKTTDGVAGAFPSCKNDHQHHHGCLAKWRFFQKAEKDGQKPSKS